MPAALALVLALLAPSTALAGGYTYSDSGVVATGRGGAWVAGADNAFAQRYNPAGLVRVEHPELQFGWSFVQQSVRFTRTDADGTTWPESVNHAKPFNVPQLGYAMPLPYHLAFAFGFTSPFAPSSDYDPAGAQRYTIIDSSVWKFSVGPSLAWQPIPQLSFGFTLSWDYFQAGQHLDITTHGDDDPTHDVEVDLAAKDIFTPGAVVGAIVEPVPWLSLGLSFTPPSSFKAKSSLSLDFAGHAFEPLLDGTRFEDDDATLVLVLPWEVRAGVAVRPVELLEIELAYVWQNWSSLGDLVVDDVDVSIALGSLTIDTPSKFVIPSSLKDVHSFRLGAEADVHELVTVRAGGFYETAGVDDDRLSVSLVDPWKVQAGGGGTVRLIDRHLELDVAGAGIYLPRKTITDSQVSQLNGLDEEGPVKVVGNGELRSVGWIVGLQARWVFAPWTRKAAPLNSDAP